MAALFDGIPNLGNLQQLLQMGQQLQSRMTELDASLGAMEVSASAGGGMVEATVDGRGGLRRLRIDPASLSAGDVEMLEDLVVAAVAEAQKKARSASEEEMRKVTGGLPIPFRLPGMP